MSHLTTTDINKSRIQKDNFMFVVIFGLWLFLLLYFDPKILKYIKWNEPAWAIISVILFVLCLNLFWLIGIYQIIIQLFSKFIVRPLIPADSIKESELFVAVLYPTMNDFNEKAILSCINQDYKNFTVFILDDSTDEKYQLQINEFIILHPQARLIRRQDHSNFKAGNLNNALAMIHKDYEYFAISDADGILPENFINKLLPFFALDKSIGFIQASQNFNPGQKIIFSKYLPYQVDLHNKYYLPAKNKFGFVMFYGHGGIIRTDVWLKSHGFPDSITEDLAFSSNIRKLGYRGIFADDIICYEDFPEDYLKYRRRAERWIKGTTEYLYKFFPGVLFSRNISWYEKSDILISAIRLLFAVPFALFLLLACIILPMATMHSHLNVPIIPTFTPLYESIALYHTGELFSTGWDINFFLVMVLYNFSEFPAVIMEYHKTPLKMLYYAIQYTFISLCSFLYFCLSSFSQIVTKKNHFFVSGLKQYEAAACETFFPIKPGYVEFFELLTALVFMYCVLKTSNIWLIPIIAALGLNIFIYRFRWETTGIHILIMLPFILTVLVIIIILLSFL